MEGLGLPSSRAGLKDIPRQPRRGHLRKHVLQRPECLEQTALTGCTESPENLGAPLTPRSHRKQKAPWTEICVQ